MSNTRNDRSRRARLRVGSKGRSQAVAVRKRSVRFSNRSLTVAALKPGTHSLTVAAQGIVAALKTGTHSLTVAPPGIVAALKMVAVRKRSGCVHHTRVRSAME